MVSKKKYKPTASDYAVVDAVGNLMDMFLQGEVESIGVCATMYDGHPAYFYADKSTNNAMMAPLSKLIGLYRMNQSFRKVITAPSQNRSYRIH